MTYVSPIDASVARPATRRDQAQLCQDRQRVCLFFISFLWQGANLDVSKNCLYFYGFIDVCSQPGYMYTSNCI